MAIKLDVEDVDKLLGFGNPDDNTNPKPQQPSTKPIPQQSTAAPVLAAKPQLQMPAAPDVQAPTLAATPPPDLGPTAPTLQKPTEKQSIQTGTAENNTSPKQEGKKQYEEGLPQVTAKPGTFEYGQQRQEVLDYQKAHPLGGDISAKPGVWGKIEHGLATAGNIAGNIIAPADMALIPGTQLNRELQAKGNENWMKQGGEREVQQAQIAASAADTWVKLHPKDKPVGGPQILGNGSLGQEMEHADGSTSVVDLGVQAKPNIAFQTVYGPGGPQIEQINKNAPGAAPTVVGAGKPVNAPVHTVPMTDPDDKKVYDYQYDNSGQVGPDHWKKIGPASRTPSRWGSYAPYYDAQGNITGFYNNKNPRQVIPAGEAGAANNPPGAAPVPSGSSTGQGENIAKGAVNAFNKDYEKPAEDVDTGYQKFEAAYKDHKAGNNNTGADSMVALSTHLATTFGSVKGARLNRDMIAEHKDAIGLVDRMERYGQSLASGQQLSDSQWEDFKKIITETRNISWQIAAKEAVRNKIPEAQFPAIPADASIQMRTPGGKTLAIQGSKVKDAIKDGLAVE